MLVLINGLPYFGQRIAKELNEFDSDNRYVFLDTYYSNWDKLRFRFLLHSAGAVLSFNGVSDKSGSLDLVLKKKRKLLMQWHGTDVKIAVARFQAGSINMDYIRNARHLFSAPWFEEELGGIVPQGIYAPFSYIDTYGNEETYEHIRVLSYLAKGKEAYYGWEVIKEAAQQLSDFEFTIVGSDGNGLDVPSNVNFLGWVSDDEMTKLYRENPIFVRLCEHDGKAFSVSQALAFGAEVIWNYPLEHVRVIGRKSNELIDEIGKAAQAVRERNMRPNADAINFARTKLERKIVLEQYAKLIQLELKK